MKSSPLYTKRGEKRMFQTLNKDMMRAVFEKRLLVKLLKKGLLDEAIYRRCRKAKMPHEEIYKLSGMSQRKYYEWRRVNGLLIDKGRMK